MTKAETWLQACGWADIVPNEMASSSDLIRHFEKELSLRDDHIRRFGFAILDGATVQAIAGALGKRGVLEIGAGTGYWSHELRRAGVDAIATDSMEWDSGSKHSDAVEWSISRAEYGPVHQLEGLAALAEYGHKRALLLVWPSYAEDWAAQVLEAYKGPQVVLVHEGRGGCVGNDRMYDILEANWSEVRQISIPQFFGIHDYVSIFLKNELARRELGHGK